MTTAARIVSVIFHPLLMTTYLFILIALYLPQWFLPVRPSPSFIFLIFALTFVLPGLNFFFFRMSGMIKNLSMADLYDRRLPFIFISLLYCIVTFMFYWKFPIPNVLRLMMVISAQVVLSTVISFFYKVSIHSLAVWGTIGILLPLNKMQPSLLGPTVATIVLAGVIMSARLLLEAHTPREILLGGICGFSTGFFGIALLF